MRRLTFSFLLLLPLPSLIVVPARAQQVDCTITVNYEAVATTHKDLLADFEQDLRDYVNDYDWGPDELDEKIKCTFTIFLKGAVGENKYSAQIFVGSQRSIYGSARSTAVLRILDETWDFTYVKTNPINHNSYSFNDLASVLDFYVYLVIGCDYDSFEKHSGQKFLQRAADVASLGRSSGQKGWQHSKSGYSRVQLIDELLDTKFAPVREASFVYHFEGLDSLGISRPRAWRNLLRAVDLISQVKPRVDPRNVLIKTFFDTKYQELAEVFSAYDDTSVYIKFSSVDPTHQSTYEDYRTGKRGG
jgi:hypothetical protein